MPRTPGEVYGSTNGPALPGSGGGGHSDSIDGTAAGGAVQIEASGHVVFNGEISARGLDSSSQGGKGSGGGVYISCRTFASTNGVIDVKGGSSGGSAYSGGSGGGGRIVLIYDTIAQETVNDGGYPLVHLRAAGGSGSNGRVARPGSVFVSDNSFFPVNNSVLYGGELLVQGFTSMLVYDLMIGGGLVIFPENFTLTVENDVMVSGNGSGVEFTNSIVSVGRDVNLAPAECGSSYFYGGASAELTIGRDVNIDDGYFYCYCPDSGETLVNGNLTVSASTAKSGMHWFSNDEAQSLLKVNGDFIVTNFGSVEIYCVVSNEAVAGRQVEFCVDGLTRICENSSLYVSSHEFTGATPLLRFASLHVETNGLISADSRGFSGGLEPTTWGYGPGASYRFDGASYGGIGGKGGYSGGTQGALYGASNAPVVLPGSGGGNHNGRGGHGGGLIDIYCNGLIHLDGEISAVGAQASGSQSGSGSGGGINIVCRRFGGGGMLRADGGPAGTSSTYSGGAGGGGRIAVCRIRHLFTGTTSVEGGIGYNEAHSGSPGTVYWYDPGAGMLFYSF